jgi:hypothetical protein
MSQTAILDEVPATQIPVAEALTLAEARDCLDWLEANGQGSFDVQMDDCGSFRIVKREEPSLRWGPRP